MLIWRIEPVKQEDRMHRTVFEAFRHSLRVAPDNAYFCVPEGAPHLPQGLEWTFAEVGVMVDRLVDAYRTAGYGPGHRVALLLDSRPEHFVHLLALNALGVSQVPVNPDYRLDELRYLLEHSGADLLVCRSHLADLGAKAAQLVPRKPPTIDVEAWPDTLPPVQRAARDEAPSPDTEAALLYTSGTTGRPKACILTNEHLLLFAQWYIDYRLEPGSRLELKYDQERLMNPLPVYHVSAGAMSFVTVTLLRGCFIMPGRFSASRWWNDVVSTRATLLHYIGLVPAALLNQPVSPLERAHGVKWGLGAGIEPSIHAAFEQRFGFPNIEVWGMTEIAAFIADDHEPRRVGQRAFGRPSRDFEARIVDDDDRVVPVGTPGQLVVRRSGPNPRRGFFAGYLDDPQATEEAWRGGWFHTGDVARQDAEGVFYFVDRKKNIIRRSGENIAASEIEAVLQADDAVAYVAVLAVPDEVRQEEVFACVVPQPGVPPDAALAQRLFELCFGRLAYYKAPGWLLFLESLPLTDTQKVRKPKIFEQGLDPRTLPGVHDFRDRKRQTR